MIKPTSKTRLTQGYRSGIKIPH